MDVLYISCYPNTYFERIIKESKVLSSQPSQKFNKMFVDGFRKNNINISVLSTFNHLKWDKEKFYVNEEIIIEDGIKYIFLSALKIKYFNWFYMSFEIKRFLNKWKKANPDGIIVMDFLKPFSYSIGKYGKGNDIVTIITDLPEDLFDYKGCINKIKNKIKLYFYNKTIRNSTHYVFITEQMNSKLNVDKKPYCIIEGLVDINMIKKHKIMENNERKICLYSGALHKELGINSLVDAFTSEKLKKYELHLYGTGNYVNEIKNITQKFENIKYFGNIANSTVVQKQMQATVLINPRPISERFTQYSFPSKTMEYMVSGTPVISTDLPGMPEEYKKYVYILTGSDVNTIINCVDKVFSKPNTELIQKGLLARMFVLANKNNIVQTQKVVDMIKQKKYKDS